jgi:hypothetical protein
VADMLTRQVATAIEPYRELLEQFVAGDISADEFEERYLPAYLGDESDRAYDVFLVIDRFFAEVEAYVGEERLRDPASGDLGPDELRECARELLRRAGLGT